MPRGKAVVAADDGDSYSGGDHPDFAPPHRPRSQQRISSAVGNPPPPSTFPMLGGGLRSSFEELRNTTNGRGSASFSPSSHPSPGRGRVAETGAGAKVGGVVRATDLGGGRPIVPRHRQSHHPPTCGGAAHAFSGRRASATSLFGRPGGGDGDGSSSMCGGGLLDGGGEMAGPADVPCDGGSGGDSSGGGGSSGSGGSFGGRVPAPDHTQAGGNGVFVQKYSNTWDEVQAHPPTTQDSGAYSSDSEVGASLFPPPHSS
jgi:hypothetical protein